jgi:hypothetical protein
VHHSLLQLDQFGVQALEFLFAGLVAQRFRRGFACLNFLALLPPALIDSWCRNEAF